MLKREKLDRIGGRMKERGIFNSRHCTDDRTGAQLCFCSSEKPADLYAGGDLHHLRGVGY